MGTLLQDLKFGFRLLLKRPVLTLAISLSLALGIGANSAIFTLVNAVLFRPLNVGSSSRLVSVYTSDFSGPQFGASAYADFVDFRDKTDVFEGLMTFSEMSTNLRYGDQSDRAFGLLTSGNYFDLLAVKAARGRTFLAEEDRTPGADPVVVISHNLWQKRFGGDATIVGKNVFLNNQAFTVIGITPESFTSTDLGRLPEIFVPLQMHSQVGFEPALTTNRGIRIFSVIGRLKPGVDGEAAQAKLNLLAHQLAGAYPDNWKDQTQAPRRISTVTQEYSRVSPDIRSMLLGLAGLFMVLCGLVLLIACSNVSNILLARATTRQREIAVRAALGASRKRIIRQLLLESIQLSLIGSVLGILVGQLCIKLLIVAFVPSSATSIPLDLGINVRVALFTIVVAVVTGVIFGLAPALHASRTDLIAALKDDSMTAHTGDRRFGVRNLLVMTQVAVSLVLLIVAGLFIRSLGKAQHLDLGYDIQNVLTLRPDAEFLEGRDAARQTAFFTGVLERVRAMPGVEAASFADMIPSASGLRKTTITVESYTPQLGEDMDVMIGVVGSAYFNTMGMKVVSGHEFTDQDRAQGVGTAVINETMARRYWPGQNPLGKRLSLLGSSRGPLEVVGVVNDTKAEIFQEKVPSFLYLSLLQNPSAGMILHVRTKGDGLEMLPALRNELNALEKGVILRGVKSLSEYMGESLLMLRIASTLTGLFGLLALLLAVVGIYSVINYSTSRRTREIGVRLALGARRSDILRLIMKDGLLMVVVGVVVGLGIAFASARLMAVFLFATSGIDIPLFIALSLLLFAVAMAACLIPAYKATKLDPIDALRYE